MEPRCNEGPRDWENLFAIRRFRYFEVIFHIFYYYWGKENRSLYRELRDRFVILFIIIIIIIIIRTLGVPTSGRLMEVGSSIEVRHQTAKSLAETSLYIETNAPQEKYYWSKIAPSPSISDCVFLHHILKMKPDFVYRTLDGRLIACLPRARPFSLSPTTSKRLLRRLAA